MKKSKQVKKSPKTDWFSYVLGDDKKLAIPIGPRFQVDVPQWKGPPQIKHPHTTLTKPDSSKWLGTVIWSQKDPTPESDIGRGRPDTCNCHTHGSVLCVKRHVTDKRAQLQKDLGSAFETWKFNEMGEVVADSWKQSEQQKFTRIVKTNPIAQGNNHKFLKLALECFPSKSCNAIVSYYFNVYLPRHISVMTRSGCTSVDTDGEEDEQIPCSKGPLKKRNLDDGSGHSSKHVKLGYLTGRR